MSTDILPQVKEKLHEGEGAVSPAAAPAGSRRTVRRYVHLYRCPRAGALTVGISVYDTVPGRGDRCSREYHHITNSSRRRLEALIDAYPGRVSVAVTASGPRVMLGLVGRAKDVRHE